MNTWRNFLMNKSKINLTLIAYIRNFANRYIQTGSVNKDKLVANLRKQLEHIPQNNLTRLSRQLDVLHSTKL